MYGPSSAVDSVQITGTRKETQSMQKHHMNRYDGHERNLAEGNQKIKQVVRSVNLDHDDVKKKAHEFLRKIEDQKVLRGKSLDVKVACVVFAAASATKKRRKLSQILQYLNTSEREVNRSFKKCKDLFKFQATQPSQIVYATCLNLELNPEIITAARTTAENFKNFALCEGKRPTTIAGVSIFMVIKQSRRYKQDQWKLLERIAKEVDISSETIKETYHQVQKMKESLIPRNFLIGQQSGTTNSPMNNSYMNRVSDMQMPGIAR